MKKVELQGFSFSQKQITKAFSTVQPGQRVIGVFEINDQGINHPYRGIHRTDLGEFISVFDLYEKIQKKMVDEYFGVRNDIGGKFEKVITHFEVY